MRFRSALAVLLLVSCNAALRRADTLYEARDWLGAAKAYDEAQTQDLEALARRDDARANCLAAGKAAPDAPQLPLFSDAPKVDHFLRGGSAEWAAMLSRAFAASVWVAPKGTAVASLSVSGQVGTFATEEEVQRTATW